MNRATLLVFACLLLLAACGGRAHVPASTAGLAAKHQGSTGQEREKRLWSLYRSNGGQVVVDIAPASGRQLDAASARNALHKDYDALYLLLKAAPSAAVYIEAVAPGGEARAITSELAAYIARNCNVADSRISVASRAAGPGRKGHVRLVIAAPRIMQALLAAGPTSQGTGAVTARQAASSAQSAPSGMSALHAPAASASAAPVPASARAYEKAPEAVSDTGRAGHAEEDLTLYFNSGRAVLDDAMKRQAARIAARLQADPGLRARLEGHSDTVGAPEANRLLSYQRALALQIELITAHGIQPERLEVAGLGESQPRGSNATAKGRELNRRVEVRLLPGEAPILARGAGDAASPGLAAAASTPAAGARAEAQEGWSESGAAGQVAGHSASHAVGLRFGAPAVAGVLVRPSSSSRPARLQDIPRAEASYTSLHRQPRQYRIEVSVSTCTLWLYEVMADGGKRLIRPFQVATAKPGTPWPRGEGRITGIDFSPWWYPTENMKRRARSIGKRLVPVPPGSSRNPMGAVKIVLSHMNAGGAYRIHGTNQPWLIGKRVSLGCIRMRNEDSLELARIVPVGTVVDIRY